MDTENSASISHYRSSYKRGSGALFASNPQRSTAMASFILESLKTQPGALVTRGMAALLGNLLKWMSS